MRVAPLVKAAAIALACWVGAGAGCAQPPRPTPTPSPTPSPTATPTPTPTASDLTIGIHLSRQADPPHKCVVSFDQESAKSAVAYTGYQVIWRISTNTCGDLKKGTLGNKALGLKFLKHLGTGQSAKWRDRCTTLPFVPDVFDAPPQVACFIPSLADKEIEKKDVEGQYEYALDGDKVDPVDPGLDVRPGR